MIYRIYKRRFVLYLIVACFLAAQLVFALKPSRKDLVPALPFGASEELLYEGEYSRALLRGVNIAELKLVAKRTAAGSVLSHADSHVQLQGEAVTKGVLLKLFGVSFHQLIDSVVEPVSLTLRRNTKLDEQGSRKRTSDTLVDLENKKLTWTEKDPNNPDRDPRVVESTITGPVHDLVSAVYSIRLQPLEPGKSFELTIIDSGRVYNIPFRVTETKKLKTVLGVVNTVCVEPEIFGDGRMLRGKGRISIWLTTDPRHIPVKARVSSELGTMSITLKRYVGTPLPQASALSSLQFGGLILI